MTVVPAFPPENSKTVKKENIHVDVAIVYRGLINDTDVPKNHERDQDEHDEGIGFYGLFVYIREHKNHSTFRIIRSFTFITHSFINE